MRISAPASTANLGPGFDCLALALSVRLTVQLAEPAAPERHPAVLAFRAGGGEGPLTVETTIPPGKGMGFSAAARVAGLAAAATQRGEHADGHGILAAAAEMEGHADNAAAAVLGGLVVTAAGRALPVPVAAPGEVVMWIPSGETSTRRSRTLLPQSVPFADAAFTVGRATLLVAAAVAGDTAALRDACADRLHQPDRLAGRPDSAAAVEAALDAGAWAAWLSGSGPSVAAWCESGRGDGVAARMPSSGHTRVVRIDDEGLRIER